MISSDLTYSTDEIFTQCDKTYIDKYISDVRKLAGDGKATARFEFAFGGGLGSAYHGYYDDLLNAFRNNKIGWLSNDFGNDLIQKNDIEITRLCGEKKTVITAKEQIHKENEIRNKKAATEDEEGYTGDTYCKRCGEMIEKGKVIPKLSSKTSEESTEDKKTSEEGEDKDTSEEEKQITAMATDGSGKKATIKIKIKK